MPGSRSIHTESSNLLAVLDELHTHTLSDGGVWLLGLNTNLLEHNALGVGRTLQCMSVFHSCFRVRLHLVVSDHPALVWGVHTPNGEDLYAVPNSLFL